VKEQDRDRLAPETEEGPDVEGHGHVGGHVGGHEAKSHIDATPEPGDEEGDDVEAHSHEPRAHEPRPHEL
jgi:hypothetical protein